MEEPDQEDLDGSISSLLVASTYSIQHASKHVDDDEKELYIVQ